jgi:20S proteasome alpha/beta subunit
MRKLVNESTLYDDKVKFSVKELMNYLCHICYEKRNSFNPYYNSIVIAGFKDD